VFILDMSNTDLVFPHGAVKAAQTLQAARTADCVRFCSLPLLLPLLLLMSPPLPLWRCCCCCSYSHCYSYGGCCCS
jgi:hypothetical protein